MIYVYKLTMLVFFSLFISGICLSQVSINSDGSNPDPNAMLEIKSNNKGLLLPRLDYNNRPATPVEGLLIYVIANGPYGEGLYFGTGTNWVKVGTMNATIGQPGGGGIVFYIDLTGLHGLAATPQDQGAGEWGCNGTLIGPGANHFGLLEGDLNTTAIVAGCVGPSAARTCDTLTLNGYSDWYLPSADELDSLRVHSAVVGGWALNQWAWSSTEWDAGGSVFVSNDPGFNPYWIVTKSYTGARIRCIRKF